jgi:cob(I)alamin adenosyltransferase
MHIYTRKGDEGMTSTLAGSRRSKADLLIWLGGAIDELQTALDRVIAQLPRSKHRSRLERVQHILWQLAGELSQESVGGTVKDPLEAHDTEELERWIDEAHLDLTGFVRFSKLIAADVSEARVRARRFERILAQYARSSEVRPEVSAYVNRLGDYLFALAVVLDSKQTTRR